jgi:hypothetical protein
MFAGIIAVFAGDIAGIVAAVATNVRQAIKRPGGIVVFSAGLWPSCERLMCST